ncbi:uncharacterized protein LOC129222548 [Uloborus diversus]|uniref:uncharacterized protein LOC129222548 n=1 Tax=Uloborus diversus TaxID=327109 RepID=UPI002409E694|nr:uncharacterized protein LOC129222548 [Uloborus diversus]
MSLELRRSFVSRLSRQQLAIIVQFMEDHPSLFLGKITPEFSVEEKRKLWKELVELLNTEGQPHKTLRKWMRTWTDWKFSVKKKVLSSGKGVGGPEPPLSDLERRCAKLLETAALAAEIQSVPHDPPPPEIFIKEEFEAEDPDDPEFFPLMKELGSPADPKIPLDPKETETSADTEVFEAKRDSVQRGYVNGESPIYL